VHYQEWIEGWELVKNQDYQEIVARTGTVGTSGGTPFAHIDKDTWAKAYKDNYYLTDTA